MNGFLDDGVYVAGEITVPLACSVALEHARWADARMPQPDTVEIDVFPDVAEQVAADLEDLRSPGMMVIVRPVGRLRGWWLGLLGRMVGRAGGRFA